MPDQSRQFATMRSALRLIAAANSGRGRAAEKIILTAPNIGELTFALANLLILVLRQHRIDPTQFAEAGLADIGHQERAQREESRA